MFRITTPASLCITAIMLYIILALNCDLELFSRSVKIDLPLWQVVCDDLVVQGQLSDARNQSVVTFFKLNN